MELGEQVAVAMESSFRCPMEHTEPCIVTSQPAESEKDVEVLKSNLTAGKSTMLIDFENGKLVDKGLQAITQKDPSPKDAIIATHGPLPIKIGDLQLPVTVAAHHIIPGEDALPKATVLRKYIWKSRGHIYSDIGYHVDGAENGVWLPTHQELSKGMGKAAKIRVPSTTDPNVLVHRSYRFMSQKEDEGAASFISVYTQQAMSLFGGQFHDAHKEYSGKVVEMLDKIGQWLLAASGDQCDQCKKSKSPDGKFPPPHMLIFRLNALSARLRSWLVGDPTTWRDGYFTSEYAKQYRDIERAYREYMTNRVAAE